MILASENITKEESWLSHAMKTKKIIGTKHKYFPIIAKKFHFKYIVKENGTISDMRELLKQKWKIIACYRDDTEDAHYSIIDKIGIFKIKILDPYIGKSRKMYIKKFKKSWYDSEKNSPWFIALKNKK
jgi:hypothetical protein